MVSAWWVGPGCLASPTRVPIHPHCHLIMLMSRVATVLLKSCIGGQSLHSLTLCAASCPASLLQLSRSHHAECGYGRVCGPAPLTPSPPDSPLRRCPFELISSSWRWSPPSPLPRSLESLCPSLPLLLPIVLEVGSESLFSLAQFAQGARRLLDLHKVRLFLHSESLSVVCQPLYDCHHSVDHRARPFRGSPRSCLHPPLPRGSSSAASTSCIPCTHPECSIRFSASSSSVRLFVIVAALLVSACFAATSCLFAGFILCS